MLYLDASALVFLYIDSEHILQSDETPRTRNAVVEMGYVATSTLALPEAVAAFTRIAQERRIALTESGQAYKKLLEDWSSFVQIPLSGEIALEASALARSRNLRGADAVHLASAAGLSRQTKGVRFLSFDDRLNEAAQGLVKLWGE